MNRKKKKEKDSVARLIEHNNVNYSRALKLKKLINADICVVVQGCGPKI